MNDAGRILVEHAIENLKSALTWLPETKEERNSMEDAVRLQTIVNDRLIFYKMAKRADIHGIMDSPYSMIITELESMLKKSRLRK